MRCCPEISTSSGGVSCQAGKWPNGGAAVEGIVGVSRWWWSMRVIQSTSRTGLECTGSGPRAPRPENATSYILWSYILKTQHAAHACLNDSNTAHALCSKGKAVPLQCRPPDMHASTALADVADPTLLPCTRTLNPGFVHISSTRQCSNERLPRRGQKILANSHNFLSIPRSSSRHRTM